VKRNRKKSFAERFFNLFLLFLALFGFVCHFHFGFFALLALGYLCHGLGLFSFSSSFYYTIGAAEHTRTVFVVCRAWAFVMEARLFEGCVDVGSLKRWKDKRRSRLLMGVGE
jgi:hypothetical protein